MSGGSTLKSRFFVLALRFLCFTCIALEHLIANSVNTSLIIEIFRKDHLNNNLLKENVYAY